MADITFMCPRCKQRLVIDEAGAGMMVNCPTCTHLLSVPAPDEDHDLKRTQRLMPFEYAKASTPVKPSSPPTNAHRKAA